MFDDIDRIALNELIENYKLVNLTPEIKTDETVSMGTVLFDNVLNNYF